MSKIDDPKVAFRLARTIASDLMLYNKEKIVEGLKADNLFVALEQELKEGKELLESRVVSDLLVQHNFMERAFIDVLIKGQAHIICPLW